MNAMVGQQDNSLMIMGDGPMQLPAHLQGVDTGVSKALLAGMYTGGNRIGLKGSRFRLVVNGIEEGVIEENYLDTILLSAAPAVSRVFYEGTYKQGGDNAPPTCYSPDGIAPPLDVPQRQSDKCATCPQNVKGSKVADGQKFKACGYFRRLVLMLAGDTEDRRVFKLDAKSGSLWGENSATAKNLNDYIKSMESRGVDVGQVVTRITFDLESSVPKLLFRPFRYIGPDELDAVRTLVASDEVQLMATVNMTTLDLSAEESNHPQEGAQDAAEQAPAQTATTTAQRPQTQAAQRPAQAQTAQRPAQRPAQQAAAPQVEEVPASAQQTAQRPQQQTAQRPVQQRPAQQTQTAQRPAQQAAQRPVQQTAPVQQKPAPAVVEVGGMEDLESILEGLE